MVIIVKSIKTYLQFHLQTLLPQRQSEVPIFLVFDPICKSLDPVQLTGGHRGYAADLLLQFTAQAAGLESPLPEFELVATNLLIQPGNQDHPIGLDEKTYNPLAKLQEWSKSQQQEVGQFSQCCRGSLDKMYERHKRRYSLCDISKVDRTVDVVLLKINRESWCPLEPCPDPSLLEHKRTRESPEVLPGV
ncbi:hypothetical protein IHE44_0002837 [Lamprotornis superbus]|uniref:Uncharacterized protein n=1 Tax=Lamprotornis superbus TaxID=245042 RepID=A0A835P2B1_9PASS|nr:hypothetical protein IHE44_0002837 [Lamprotornis superbus]